MIVVFVDGLCEPRNPGGTATYGFVVLRDGATIAEDKAVVGSGRGMSNNVAEYSGLLAALGWLAHRGLEGEMIEMNSDSRLVVQQMSGGWEDHGGLYTPYHEEAARLKGRFPRLTFKWIPGESNGAADRLSREAYEEWCRRRGIPAVYHSRRARRSPAPRESGPQHGPAQKPMEAFL